jgi:hypothetical protein
MGRYRWSRKAGIGVAHRMGEYLREGVASHARRARPLEGQESVGIAVPDEIGDLPSEIIVMPSQM